MRQKFASCLGVYTFCPYNNFKTCVLGLNIAEFKLTQSLWKRKFEKFITTTETNNG